MNKFKKLVRIITVIIVGLSIFSCNDDDLINSSINAKGNAVVTIDLAKKVALNFTKDEAFIGKPDKKGAEIALRASINSKSIPFSGFEEKEVNEIIELKGSLGETVLFVFKFLPDGFVIVPATKKETPILAFSNNEIFNYADIPQGIQDWINERTFIVEELQSNDDIPVSDEIEEQWDCVAPPIDEEEIISGGSIYEQVSPLLETNWGQLRGYNEFVRFNNCTAGTAPTGCVATAMVQIMRYWEYPNTYNWSIMPNKIYESTPLDNSTQEIARLMQNAGQSVNMTYSCIKSGAATSDARNALVNTFGYSNYATYTDFNTNTAVSQLNSNWPILMRGDDTSGGHAWVNDGYKRTKYIIIHNPGTVYEYETYTISGFYFHMNWGWNGDSTGWFLYNDFTPGLYDFTNNNKMIINIHP